MRINKYIIESDAGNTGVLMRINYATSRTTRGRESDILLSYGW